MYRLLGKPALPARPLLRGAFLGAFGFELLKLLVVNVLGSVGGSALAPLAIAITLVVWINYFSRLVLYGASWAMTSRLSDDAAVGPLDRSEAAVAVADLADAKARLPVGVGAMTATPAVRGRFDTGSAVFGAIAGALVAALWGRSS
jgi:membrane protein